MENITLTRRLRNVFNITEELLNERKVIFPIDIFIAMILDNTGVLIDLNNHFFNNLNNLKNIALNLPKNPPKHKSLFFNTSISNTTLEALNLSIQIMNQNKQIYLNECHLLKAMISSTNELTSFLNKDDLSYLLKLSETTKDLIVNLENYKYAKLDNNNFIIRKALSKDRYILYDFIKENFSSVWADTVSPLFSSNLPPIYIAILNKTVVGFSAYDIFGPGTFGPIGVLKDFRNMNLGKILLNNCLLEMKARGDSYVIIKNAGPIEFYEKCCNAKII